MYIYIYMFCSWEEPTRRPAPPQVHPDEEVLQAGIYYTIRLRLLLLLLLLLLYDATILLHVYMCYTFILRYYSVPAARGQGDVYGHGLHRLIVTPLSCIVVYMCRLIVTPV